VEIIDKIIKCEHKYLECFCLTTEQQDCIRFWDDLIPDCYSHNYTWVKSEKNDSILNQLVESEIDYSKSQHKNFCWLRCHTLVNKTVLESLCHTPEISMSGYYVFDISKILKLSHAAKCEVLKVNKPEMIEELLCHELKMEGDNPDIDFCTRKIYRHKDIYLADTNLNSYICYDIDGVVGSCDLFIFGDTAKIEDFSVLPQKQRKGYGTAILKTLINIAIEKNVNTIYLETDESGTAKTMFEKCGFTKVYEFIDLLFSL